MYVTNGDINITLTLDANTKEYAETEAKKKIQELVKAIQTFTPEATATFDGYLKSYKLPDNVLTRESLENEAPF